MKIAETSMYIWPTVLFFALIPCVLSNHFRGGLLTWKAINESQVCVHSFKTKFEKEIKYIKLNEVITKNLKCFTWALLTYFFYI